MKSKNKKIRNVICLSSWIAFQVGIIIFSIACFCGAKELIIASAIASLVLFAVFLLTGDLSEENYYRNTRDH